MISYAGQDSRRKAARRIVTAYVAPKVREQFVELCERQGHTYGEKLALWVQAELMRSQEQEATAK